MRFKKFLLCLSVASTGLAAQTIQHPLWMRYPSISPNGQEIAFTYKGDIYKVPVSGGLATRLTTNAAFESRPIWSPDGKQIAFTSDRNQQGTNIYIMSADGGTAHQLTTHSATEVPYSFTPDGKYILFKSHIQDPASSALYPSRVNPELYRVPAKGGRIELVLPVPAEYAQMSPDGKRIVFQDLKGYENEWRKHHTSSITRDLLEYDIQKKTYRFVVQHDGEDRNPIYAPDGKHLYFLSERKGGSMNIYQSSLNGSGEAKPLTKFSGEPVRFLSSATSGKLCFGYAGEIYTLTPGEKPQKVSISLQAPEEVDEFVDLTLTRGLGATSLSPDGKQLAYISRGEVFVTATDYSTTKRITETAGTERSVSFGPDNRSLVYDSRRGGNWDLYITRIQRSEDPNFPNATTLKEELLIPSLKGEKGFPKYSPDGKEVAFVYERERIMVYNLQSKSVRQVTDGRYQYAGSGEIDFEWSPDSKWFVLSYDAEKHAPYSDIGIVSASGNGQIVNLTNSGYFCSNPHWAMDGNAIIYSTDRYGMRNHASWGSMNDAMIVFLNREAYAKYQMNQEEYDLYTEAQKKSKAADKAKNTKDTKATPAPDKKQTVIEWENIEERTVRLTPNSSQMGDAVITPDGSKLYYLSAVEDRYDLWSMDLRKKDAHIVRKLNISGSSMVFDKDGKNMFILGSTAQKMSLAGESFKSVSLASQIHIDKNKEREAMFAEVAQEEAERFYRKDMHGVNWAKLTKEYQKYLPHINNSYDFAEMLSELLGELNVSHTGSGYRAGGSHKPTAELGLFVSNPAGKDGLVVDEIIVGGPFDRHDTKLRKGDIIEQIDGKPIVFGQDYFPLLNGKVGERTLVTFYSPTTKERHEEVVRPISASVQEDLLYKRWVKQRAAEVDRLSGGKLGYVHIPSMADEHFRTMYSEALGRYYGRQGLVVDIRYNSGGRLHEDIEVFLSGEQYLEQVVRDKNYCQMPSRRWNRPSVMLTCEANYSNAHGTPWVYQYRKIGKLVGMPVAGTMTSVNWVNLQDPTLYFGIPVTGYRQADGQYLENAQVEPDVKVMLDYGKLLDNNDNQLQKAVEVLLADPNVRKPSKF